MVNEIYYDFIRIISKERKIEANTLINDIGALIYTSSKAAEINLINDEISINDLITKIVNKKVLENYKVIKLINPKYSLIRELLSANFYNEDNNIKFECISLRSSFSAILSYELTGC